MYAPTPPAQVTADAAQDPAAQTLPRSASAGNDHARDAASNATELGGGAQE